MLQIRAWQHTASAGSSAVGVQSPGGALPQVRGQEVGPTATGARVTKKASFCCHAQTPWCLEGHLAAGKRLPASWGQASAPTSSGWGASP